MVFVHSRKDTGKTARTLIDLAANAEQLELFMNHDHPKFSLMKARYLHNFLFSYIPFSFFSHDFIFCVHAQMSSVCSH
jgi:hypothetical protein